MLVKYKSHQRAGGRPGQRTTSGAILRHTNIFSLQVVEISPEVLQGAHLFTNFNDNVFANPRFHVTIEDAKSFLKTTTQKFDFIVSEPSNPWMAGVAAVFSLEYYQSCADRLVKGGTMVQWVQNYETSDRTLQTVIKTFSAVFPFVSIWRAQPGDLILVGNTEPTHIDIDAFVERMRVYRIGRDLARGGCSEPLALLSRHIISPSNGAFIARPEDVVTATITRFWIIWPRSVFLLARIPPSKINWMKRNRRGRKHCWANTCAATR